jgi:hypothetical protein
MGEKKKIHLFGDSFTRGHGHSDDFSLYIDWRRYRDGVLPPNWFDILSIKFDYDCVNYGLGGMSNREIFDTFSQNSHLIESGDIVIINWTFFNRFRWIRERKTDNDQIVYDWIRLGGNFYFEYDNPHYEYLKSCISKDTIKDIVAHQSFPIYADSFVWYENLIDQYAKSKGFDVYYWSADDSIIYTQDNLFGGGVVPPKYLCLDLLIENYEKIKDVEDQTGLLCKYIIYLGGKKIFYETDRMVDDITHLGEIGHKIQAELFYDHIMKHRLYS